MKRMTLTLLLLTMNFFPISSYSYAQQENSSLDLAYISTSVSEAKRKIALDLSHQYTKIAPFLQSNINQYSLAVDANEVFQSSGINSTSVQQAEQTIRRAKGLNFTENSIISDPSSYQAQKNTTGKLLQLRLADADMLTSWQQGSSPLFAFEPEGNDEQWVNIEAYDIHGNIHLLDVYQLPKQPVLVVSLDKKQATREGIAVMRQIFASNQTLKQSKSITTKTLIQSDTQAEQPISCTAIERISLQNDREPWVSGKADIYGIVTGINPTRDEPTLDVVDMHYLDYDKKEYYPNQIIIHWERYRWSAADLVLMEHDDATNYRDLATALLVAAGDILKTIPDPEVQSYAAITKITNGLLNVMPESWFINDDDYVDVYYTLQEGVTYSSHAGSTDNANTTFKPLMIQPR